MASSYDRRSSSSASRPRDRASASREQSFREPSPRASVSPARSAASSVYAAPPVSLGSRDPRKGSYYKRMRLLAACMTFFFVAIVVYVVLVYSPLFEIKSIAANPTEHVTSEQIRELASVPSGSTLFGLDEEGVTERLSANPWIASVTLSRVYPDELVINVVEREAAAIVMLANGSEAWYIASDGYWLEEVPLADPTVDTTAAAPADQARALATSENLVYVTDVSALVKPEAGTACTEEGLMSMMEYIEGFSDAFLAMVVVGEAPSAAAISIVLSNGIEVSLGEPEDIELKEKVILGLLQQYPGQITYINVRVPALPTWRALDASLVGEAPEDGGGIPDDAVAAEPESSAVEDAATEDVYDEASSYMGTEEGGPGGWLDEGGYYDEDGTWIYAYTSSEGIWINGYYDDDGNWVAIS